MPATVSFNLDAFERRRGWESARTTVTRYSRSESIEILDSIHPGSSSRSLNADQGTPVVKKRSFQTFALPRPLRGLGFSKSAPNLRTSPSFNSEATIEPRGSMVFGREERSGGFASSLFGRLPTPLPRHTDSPSPLSLDNPPKTPTRVKNSPLKDLPLTPPDSTASTSHVGHSLLDSSPESVHPGRESRNDVASPEPARARSLEYSSSQGSSYQEPTEVLRRSSSGSRHGFPRAWLGQGEEDWFKELSDAGHEASSEACAGVEIVEASVGGPSGDRTATDDDVFASSPERAKRNALLLSIPTVNDSPGKKSDSEGSSSTPSSRFSDSVDGDGDRDRDSLESRHSLPFQYVKESDPSDLGRIDHNDHNSLISSPGLSYPAQPRSPGVQPLHLPLRSRPVSRTPSSPFPYTYSTVGTPTTATSTSPANSSSSSPRTSRHSKVGRHSLLVPKPPTPTVRRRPSSASEVDGLKELLFRTRPLSIKRHIGVQASSALPPRTQTTTVATQTDAAPSSSSSLSLLSLPRSMYHRPAPLRLASSPTTPGISTSPLSGSRQTFATTPNSTDEFATARSSSPANRGSGTVLGPSTVDDDEEDYELHDAALAEFVPAVLSPPPVACRASIVPLYRPQSSLRALDGLSPTLSVEGEAQTPVMGSFGRQRSEEASERSRALEDEVARLTKVISILTGGLPI
ncbi:hypothetical protein RQP46_007740 [Phenoliferia psychrophenolica]